MQVNMHKFDFRINNGIVGIGDFTCELSEFLQYEPNFSIPDAEHLHYKKGELCALIKNDNQYGDDSYPWKMLDNYIEKVETYIQAREVAKPVYVETYADKRNKERGFSEEQLEYIVENGIDAFINRDMAIRAKYPKE